MWITLLERKVKGSQRRFLMGSFIIKCQWEKAKNKMGGRRSEGLIADPRNKKEGGTEDREERRRLLR